ncbi:Spore coat polysaccharide biosynthesis protein F, CMP-KDO synthetase [Exiguobacterium sp. 8H]|uniref:cytidylyltransferase domain-containing protein n=1 Tax=unclassified Exiguobacterium TaxID=2644629 RepID=UPI0012EFDAF7|nr:MULTISPECIES: glycosyltransferase family protein [unclassified Exiguobacterium]VXB47184.1 Spore coat polysaccharide biosynthesis protein F, CMP-KDO synthetase [Exiguobacterium sp. 8A]VXB48968.1 Spore coat polysaccharide biosynthesis protein F, CMP-KDO synthetase [Exiguobacterium sp. 8H]
MAMKTVAIIQARMGSTRLPGKVLMKLQGRTVLDHVIARVKQAKLIDEIIVATTTLSEDDVLSEEAKRYGVRVYRGSSDNVLSRYYEAAMEAEAEVVIRITSDCPLIDPFIIDHVIQQYRDTTNHLVTNVGTKPSERTFPRGLDVEVFSFESLFDAYHHATKDYEQEHVTPLIYEQHQHNVSCYDNETNYSQHRWTLDTPEDLKLISEIYSRLYKGEHDFYLEDIIRLFKEDPQLIEINKHIEQKVIR